MINTNKRSAFTLVELIVVITILAILATIAFLSVGSYTQDAKNTKVVQDLNGIKNSLSTEIPNGSVKLETITEDSANKPSSLNIGGTSVASGSGLYDAGKLNYTVIKGKKEEFLDSNGREYISAWAKKSGAPFELAGVVVKEGTDTAIVVGTYTPRKDNPTIEFDGTSNDSDNSFTITQKKGIKYFKKGDTVVVNGTNLVIKNISKDGTILRFTDTPKIATSGVTKVKLAIHESPSLITKGNSTDFVENDATEATGNLPY